MRLSLLSGPTVLSAGIQGFGLAVRLVFVMALAKMASPATLGHFGLLTAIELITIYAAGFELHTFTTRRYARHLCPTQLRICFAAHTWMLRFTAALAALIAAGMAWVFGVGLDATGYACFGVVAATGTVTQETSRYLVQMGKPIRSIVLFFLRTTGWMPFALFFIGPQDNSVRNILVAWAIASLLAMCWGLHAVRAALSRNLRMRARYVAHALRRSLSYYAVATASVIQANVERFVLQVLLGPVAVGIYSLFLTLANALTAMIQAGVLNIFLPRLLQAFGAMAADRRAVLQEAMKRALFLCVVMSVMILGASVPIVHLTEHAEYLSYWWILPMLLAGQVILMWTQPIHLALFGAHHDRLLLTITAASLVGSLAVSAALVSMTGIAGAAFAPLIVSLAVAFARRAAFARLEARGEA